MTPADRAKVVLLDVTNHAGVRSLRRVLPRYVWHGVTEWHPGEPQWYLRAVCLERGADRDFPLSAIHGWRAWAEEG